MAKILANGQPSDQSGYFLHPSLDLKELRQTSPSRIAYHQYNILKGETLSLSKRIGLLLWLNDHSLLTEWGGQRRLLMLQKQTKNEFSLIEVYSAALKFRHILNTQPKKQMDFFHHAVVLNSLLPEREIRRREKRRIGIGYRDKGTLPNLSERARVLAEGAYWYRVEDVGFELADGFPIVGEWVDLSEIIAKDFPIP